MRALGRGERPERPARGPSFLVACATDCGVRLRTISGEAQPFGGTVLEKRPAKTCCAELPGQCRCGESRVFVGFGTKKERDAARAVLTELPGVLRVEESGFKPTQTRPTAESTVHFRMVPATSCPGTDWQKFHCQVAAQLCNRVVRFIAERGLTQTPHCCYRYVFSATGIELDVADPLVAREICSLDSPAFDGYLCEFGDQGTVFAYSLQRGIKKVRGGFVLSLFDDSVYKHKEWVDWLRKGPRPQIHREGREEGGQGAARERSPRRRTRCGNTERQPLQVSHLNNQAEVTPGSLEEREEEVL
ncbi:hypothetical protein DIPPA_04033 [Diplonema papillatum]|nr:hypothetical protein DIPPA_04033 [Diplonema papillatum]